MTSSWKSFARLGAGACALLAAGAAPALAALGEPLAGAGADGSVSVSAHSLRAGAAPGLSHATVRTASGVTVQEYAGADGVVFALSWSGPTLPDLQRLYGSYFPGYAAARDARAPGAYRAPVSLRGTQLVAHAWGHMRDYAGSAYVPALLPPGVDLASLGVQP